MQDTTTSATERYYELLRAQGPVQRLGISARLSRSVRELAEAGIRAELGYASPELVKACLAERLYGREVAARLFPDLLSDDR